MLVLDYVCGVSFDLGLGLTDLSHVHVLKTWKFMMRLG